MLSAEKNELLTRVGPGTAMGALIRGYWLPVYASADLPADGRPAEVRLLSEDLLLWRATSGAVSLVAPVCPHRGAPLGYARNEDDGLRCVYHGWKFDGSGRCVDMPTEPADSTFADRIRLRSHPCRERNGVVWAWLGDSEPPELPEVEWNLVPEDQVHVSLRVQHCNWLQALEGEVDSAHAPLLHGRVDGQGSVASMLASSDLRPVFEVLRREFGVTAAASRRVGDDETYWRITQFVLPFYTMVPPQGRYPELSGHAWVPIDDLNTLCVMFTYHPDQPLPERMRQLFAEGHHGRETGHISHDAYDPDARGPYARYVARYRAENDFGLDYEAQVSTYFSGMPGLWVQDAACQSGAARLLDRTAEHLGSSDAGITLMRRQLLDAVRRHHEDGTWPATATDPTLSMVRAVSLQLKQDESWFEAAEAPMQARLGSGFGYEIP